MLVSFPEIGTVKADTTIYIRPNGDIESTGLIERNGDVYRFTCVIYSPIIIERNNIVLDGGGYTLEGSSIGVAINLTTSNVTVKNIHIMDWQTGILGAYNNNTLSGNAITGCSYGIKIYADNYSIIGNHIENNDEGIRLHGGLNLVSQNNITGNNVGIRLQGYESHLKNVIVRNTIRNNEEGIFAYAEISHGIYQEIYNNNFVNNTNHYFGYGTDMGSHYTGSAWDDGVTGNYWSNYNGTDNNGDGIGDTPYVIDVDNQDNYPLMAPVDISVIPEFPSWIILPLFLIVTLFAVTIKRVRGQR
jgi:nitrous oxidase accessory protein NosD